MQKLIKFKLLKIFFKNLLIVNFLFILKVSYSEFILYETIYFHMLITWWDNKLYIFYLIHNTKKPCICESNPSEFVAHWFASCFSFYSYMLDLYHSPSHLTAILIPWGPHFCSFCISSFVYWVIFYNYNLLHKITWKRSPQKITRTRFYRLFSK